MSSDKRGETFVIKDSGEGSGQKPIEFNTFVLGLASAALINLGDAPHPETGQPQLDLELARQSLDLLTLIREKTRGNLTADEEKFFENVLADLRLRYVAAARNQKT
jgi:hypothetical protein